MKSILIGLLLLSWIHSSECYSQTDSVYCLPLTKARLLVASALRLSLADSLNENLSARVDLLESQQLESYRSYTNLLKLSEQKYERQKETTLLMENFAASHREEADYYRKKYRKQRRQKGLLTAGMVVLLGLILVK